MRADMETSIQELYMNHTSQSGLRSGLKSELKNAKVHIDPRFDLQDHAGPEDGNYRRKNNMRSAKVLLSNTRRYRDQTEYSTKRDIQFLRPFNAIAKDCEHMDENYETSGDDVAWLYMRILALSRRNDTLRDLLETEDRVALRRRGAQIDVRGSGRDCMCSKVAYVAGTLAEGLASLWQSLCHAIQDLSADRTAPAARRPAAGNMKKQTPPQCIVQLDDDPTYWG